MLVFYIDDVRQRILNTKMIDRSFHKRTVLWAVATRVCRARPSTGL